MPATKSCSFEGCNKVARARGLCPAHYQQWRKGKPLTPLEPRRPQRKWKMSQDEWREYILANSTPVDGPLDTPCRIWNLRLGHFGYGSISINKRCVGAHRVSYEVHHGPIPDGQMICHRCDTPPCIAPDHIYAGTPLDNMRDCVERGRRPRGENAWQAKLTRTQVREIRRRYEEAGGNILMATLAGEFGVSDAAIWLIVHGRNWKEDSGDVAAAAG